MGSDPMVKKFFSHYAPRPWGMQPNTSLAANFPHSPWAFPCSCLCVYHTIFGNFWVNSCDSCGRQVILCFTAPSGLNGVLPHCRKMLITWEGGGVALARCGLDEQREEVELEGPGEAKAWLGESFTCHETQSQPSAMPSKSTGRTPWFLYSTHIRAICMSAFSCKVGPIINTPDKRMTADFDWHRAT